MIDVEFDLALDLLEWYYVLTHTFTFNSKGSYTRLEFVKLGRVEL